jgi:RNA-directed DNA polymerase
VRAQAYEQDWDENLSALVERLKRKSDRAKRVSRHDMPNGDGQVRPVGIPAVEDKRLQWAVTRRLTASDAQEFLRCRDGSRPRMGALDAVDTLTSTRPLGRYHGVVEAAIKGFCDHSDHAWMIRMLAERIEDRARRWLIKTWLKAGVLDTDGQVRHPGTGTPQGGSSSPRRANVYRHDALELWFETVVKHQGRGEACRSRYADDFVCAFERPAAAERVYALLGQRLGQFGLELSADKTRVRPVSRHPPAPQSSCACLGFECRWDKDRVGKAPVTRRTARQKLRNSLKRFTQWCRENRHLRLGVLLARRNAQRRGYDHDDGVARPFCQPQAVLLPGPGDPEEVAQSASPTAPRQRGGRYRTAGALQDRPTTDRWATQDQDGHFEGIGRIADASLPEEPGAGTLHAGICAGAVG